MRVRGAARTLPPPEDDVEERSPAWPEESEVGYAGAGAGAVACGSARNVGRGVKKGVYARARERERSTGLVLRQSSSSAREIRRVDSAPEPDCRREERAVEPSLVVAFVPVVDAGASASASSASNAAGAGARIPCSSVVAVASSASKRCAGTAAGAKRAFS